jgi:hypothetical protein
MSHSQQGCLQRKESTVLILRFLWDTMPHG